MRTLRQTAEIDVNIALVEMLDELQYEIHQSGVPCAEVRAIEPNLGDTRVGFDLSDNVIGAWKLVLKLPVAFERDAQVIRLGLIDLVTTVHTGILRFELIATMGDRHNPSIAAPAWLHPFHYAQNRRVSRASFMPIHRKARQCRQPHCIPLGTLVLSGITTEMEAICPRTP